jgi:hypothetical protein
MSAFSPQSFQEALERRNSHPQKPRKPLSRGNGLGKSKSSLERNSGSKKRVVRKGKKKTLPSRKKLIAELDRLTSLIVRARDGCCVVTGSVDQLTCGHLFSRRSMATRFDISDDGNCHAQAWASNFRHTFDSYPYQSWYRKKFGQEKLDALYQRWLKGHKYSTLELRQMVEEYRAHPLVQNNS